MLDEPLFKKNGVILRGPQDDRQPPLSPLSGGRSVVSSSVVGKFLSDVLKDASQISHRTTLQGLEYFFYLLRQFFFALEF